MKKLIIVAFILLSGAGIAQNEKNWRIGIQWGFNNSHSYLSGGMQNANARFGNDDAGGGAFNLQARYDINKHWMFSTGFGFQSYGFKFSLAQNYSLSNPIGRFQGVQSEFAALEVPLMWHYKFNPNCKNAKWVLGAGWVHSVIGAQTSKVSYVEGAELNTNSNSLSSEMKTLDGYCGLVRFTVSREKEFKKGNILNLSLVFNAALRNIAEANVVYTVDGNTYNHSFTNRGNFVGLRLTYFFRPFSFFKS